MTGLGIAAATTARAIPAQRGLGRRFTQTVEAAGLPGGPGDDSVVTADQIAHLPPVVQRYLRFMGVVGRPRVWSFRVFIDDAGAPLDFSTTDRFAAMPTGPVRAEWRTPVQNWQSTEGWMLPGHMSAVWRLPDGDLPYFKGSFVPSSLQVNLSPSCRRGAVSATVDPGCDPYARRPACELA